MNNNYLCHIIRDIFPVRNNIILYGDMKDLQLEMSQSIHGMGSFLLHTDRSNQVYKDSSCYWEIGINGPYMGYNYADLFISINYNPELLSDNYQFIAEQIKSIVKEKGFVFLINPGIWHQNIKDYLSINNHLVNEVKRYSMLKNEKVFIYENI